MRRSFTIEPYQMRLLFVWNIKPQSLAKMLKREYGIELEGNDDYEGISVDLGQSSYLIFIPEADASIDTYVTCIHEACHVAQWILKRVNVTEEESLCYCVDCIASKLMHAISQASLRSQSQDAQPDQH